MQIQGATAVTSTAIFAKTIAAFKAENPLFAEGACREMCATNGLIELIDILARGAG